MNEHIPPDASQLELSLFKAATERGLEMFRVTPEDAALSKIESRRRDKALWEEGERNGNLEQVRMELQRKNSIFGEGFKMDIWNTLDGQENMTSIDR